MKTTRDPLLWAARRLHRVLSAGADQESCALLARAEHLLNEQAATQRICRLLAAATSRGWLGSADRLRERLMPQAARVQQACAALSRDPPRRPAPPPLPDLLAELRQLDQEFEHVEVDPRGGRLCALTQRIELEGISLGAFSIQLCLERLASHPDASAFAIVAQDPNPASGNDDVTHPHVKGEGLCAGEATVPIASALSGGRIADAFALVSAVLQTYNAGSPYVSLEEWDGHSCGDCGRGVSRDDGYYCDACGRDFCDGCTSNCDRCDRSLCLNCLEEDNDGEGTQACDRCRQTCRSCGRYDGSVAGRRLRHQGGLCDACRADEEKQDEAEEAEEEDRDDDAEIVVATAGATIEHSPSTPTEQPHEPHPVQGRSGPEYPASL